MKGKVTKRGKSWTIMVDLPRDPATGKRRQRRITAATKKEAEVRAAELLASIEHGGFTEADADKITVREYLERWLASLNQSVRPTTHARYTDIVNKHILPTLGRKQLTKLTPLEVQALYSDRLGAGLSPTTVAMIHGILHKALRQAMQWGLLTRNVTEATRAPRKATSEFIVWNQEQVAAFFAVSDQDSLSALWRLALLTGMRRGELLALSWEDVDLRRKSLSVRRTLSRSTDGTFVFGVPKSAKGKRLIALPPSCVDALSKHRLQQVQSKWALNEAYNDQDLVFTNGLGEPLHPNTLISRFEKLMERASLPRIRFHDLRHTSATLMLANGTHPKVVQERLGHADISMTLNRYSHVTMDMQRQAADSLDTFVSGL